jgi:hypothetical protein
MPCHALLPLQLLAPVWCCLLPRRLPLLVWALPCRPLLLLLLLLALQLELLPALQLELLPHTRALPLAWLLCWSSQTLHSCPGPCRSCCSGR